MYHLPTFTPPSRHFSASKFDAKLHAQINRHKVRKRLPHETQKVTKITYESNFIVQAGTHDLAAIYYTLTLATFVPSGTDKNIAQGA